MDSAQSDVDAIRSEAAGTDILDPNLNMSRLEEIRRDFKRATSRLNAELKRLQSAQTDLASAEQQLKPVQQSSDAPAFKAPKQTAFAKSLGISERKLRDLLDAFKTDLDIDSLRWARMTEQQFSRFNRWLVKEQAAA